MDIIEASIPLFFLLIGIELAVAKATGRPYYRLNDSIADLSLGILSQLSGIFLALLTYALFGWVSTRCAVQRFLPVPAWPDGPPFDAAARQPIRAEPIRLGNPAVVDSPYNFTNSSFQI